MTVLRDDTQLRSTGGVHIDKESVVNNWISDELNKFENKQEVAMQNMLKNHEIKRLELDARKYGDTYRQRAAHESQDVIYNVRQLLTSKGSQLTERGSDRNDILGNEMHQNFRNMTKIDQNKSLGNIKAGKQSISQSVNNLNRDVSTENTIGTQGRHTSHHPGAVMGVLAAQPHSKGLLLSEDYKRLMMVRDPTSTKFSQPLNLLNAYGAPSLHHEPSKSSGFKPSVF